MAQIGKTERERREARAALIATMVERQRIEMILSMMEQDDPRRAGLAALVAG